MGGYTHAKHLQCRKRNKKELNEEDYMFADPKLAKTISKVQVEDNDEIPTHKPIKCELQLGKLDKKSRNTGRTN